MKAPQTATVVAFLEAKHYMRNIAKKASLINPIGFTGFVFLSSGLPITCQNSRKVRESTAGIPQECCSIPTSYPVDVLLSFCGSTKKKLHEHWFARMLLLKKSIFSELVIALLPFLYIRCFWQVEGPHNYRC